MSISQHAAPLRQPRARLPRTTRSSTAPKSRTANPATVTPVRLRVVAPADAREGSSAAFIAACVLVLAMGLAALLMLNTQRAQQSFTIDRLKAESATYTGTQQGLNSQLQLAESPRSLAARAQSLGLLPAATIRYVGPDGKTVGVAKGAGGAVPFTVGPLTAGGASKVAGAASLGASLGLRVGAPAPKKAAVAGTKKTAAKPGVTTPSVDKAAKPGTSGGSDKVGAASKPGAVPKAKSGNAPKSSTAGKKSTKTTPSTSTSGTTPTTQR